ncbi:ABC transporter ATP-binding protein [Nocardioides sp. Root151]|uniref:ABC transporter ATP-binding protein n=1 Tax=Nocardioides sp. Root151 TaxID=1736475 RepID=UPI000702FFB3|nr:ABC transporter ATP-binding protein [Nocardioides sp. Root151]KQZ66879.1 sulfonate ABC transporter ATP-binding protein [Nocardioides sp. Root151]
MAAHSGLRPTTTAPVVVESLVRGFGPKGVLNGVDLTIEEGEFVALLGPSGCGKSTLLRALAGLDRAVSGSGRIVVPAERAVVFQDSRLLPWARVLDNITLGQRGKAARDVGRTALREVGLEGRDGAWPHELSGGEQQRAALARSLVRDPKLLLADEPFGALDALTRLKMHELLRKLHRAHQPSVLLVTHDVDEAIKLADRVVVLDHGRIAVEQVIDLDGDRDPSDPRFAAIRKELLATLGVGETTASDLRRESA